MCEVCVLSAMRCRRGELPEDMAAAYERQAKGFEALQRSLASLAECLERTLPPLPEAKTRIAASDGGVHLVPKAQVLLLPSCCSLLTGPSHPASAMRRPPAVLWPCSCMQQP